MIFSIIFRAGMLIACCIIGGWPAVAQVVCFALPVLAIAYGAAFALNSGGEK